MNARIIHPLNGDAFDYLCAELRKGGAISSNVNLGPGGHLWTYLPFSTAQSHRMEDFKEGGVFSPEDAWLIMRAVVAFVGDFLEEEPSNVLLAEDQFFRIEDPPNLGVKHLFEYRGTCYHYLTQLHATSSLEEIEQALNSGSNYPQIVFLTKIPPQRVLPSRAKIDEELAQKLTANAAHIIVGAYDEEGYVIWSDKANGQPVV